MKKMDAVAALAALAQETRLDIFRLLVQAGAAGRPAGRIGELLGLPSPTLAFHLKQLKYAGLVTFTRVGRSLIYTAAYATMGELLAYLTENCCKGVPAADNQRDTASVRSPGTTPEGHAPAHAVATASLHGLTERRRRKNGVV